MMGNEIAGEGACGMKFEDLEVGWESMGWD